jgi:hypothetical protein
LVGIGFSFVSDNELSVSDNNMFGINSDRGGDISKDNISFNDNSAKIFGWRLVNNQSVGRRDIDGVSRSRRCFTSPGKDIAPVESVIEVNSFLQDSLVTVDNYFNFVEVGIIIVRENSVFVSSSTDNLGISNRVYWTRDCVKSNLYGVGVSAETLSSNSYLFVSLDPAMVRFYIGNMGSNRIFVDHRVCCELMY